MVRMPRTLLLPPLAALMAMAGPPAWGQEQAPASAGDAAAPVVEAAVITLKIMRHDPSGRVAFADIGITHELPPGTTCDAVSGDGGEIRCRVPCDPADKFNKLFRAVTEDRSDYDRTPARVTARLVGCRIDPATLTVTYRHFRVRKAEIRTALGTLLLAEPALPAAILEAGPASAEVGAALAAISEKPDKAGVVGRFQRLVSDLAALELKDGAGEPAAQFSAYATAATNVMLADIAKRYAAGGDQAIATTGDIGVFIDNAGKLAVKVGEETRIGEVQIPLDLQFETVETLAAVNKSGKLDGAAQADVYKLWNAHRAYEPVM